MSMLKNPLGKGIASLLGEMKVDATAVPSAAKEGRLLRELALTDIRPSKFQPRRHFDEQALKDLSVSILQNGVLQPIVVRSSGDEIVPFEIVAGERRWRAAKIAGLSRIPVRIIEISERQSMEIALVENVQREDLSVLEEAQGYQRLIDEFGYTQEQLGSVIGKSRSHIANFLRLLSLPDIVREKLETGVISMGHARALLRAGDPEKLIALIEEKGLNVRETERIVQDSLGDDAKYLKKKKESVTIEESANLIPDYKENKIKTADIYEDNYIKQQFSKQKDELHFSAIEYDHIIELQKELEKSLGMKVRIIDRGGKGELTFYYPGHEQLDMIIARLA